MNKIIYTIWITTMTFNMMIEKKLLDIIEESTCDALTKIMLKEKLLYYYELDRNKIEYSDDDKSDIESDIENDIKSDVETDIKN